MSDLIPTIINNFNAPIGHLINHVDNFYAAPSSSPDVRTVSSEVQTASSETQTPSAADSASAADSSTPSGNIPRANVEDVSYEPVESWCPYINREKIREIGLITPLEFQNKLHEACYLNGRKLADFLKHNERLGYLHFLGHSKKQIFDTLCSFFPGTISYKYTNFANYF